MKKYELTRYELVRVRVDHKPFWLTLSGCLLNAVTALKKSTLYAYVESPRSYMYSSAKSIKHNTIPPKCRALGLDLFVALFGRFLG